MRGGGASLLMISCMEASRASTRLDICVTVRHRESEGPVHGDGDEEDGMDVLRSRIWLDMSSNFWSSCSSKDST